MFKRNVFKILAIVFFLLAGASFYNSTKTIQKKVIENKSFDVAQDKSVVKKIISPSPAVVLTKAGPTTEPTQYIIPTSITKGSENPTPTSPAEASAKEGQGLKVSLTINSSSVGSIDLSNGANQCDVLSQALSQGKIQSLNMRYNNDMGTNAVYQINGVGKENAVWWTFKVNGQSPSQGCSYIKVGNGDNVEWSYIGN
ncbi:MAG: DUF4430 domain-containing protein [Patescibacteria group bacterium]